MKVFRIISIIISVVFMVFVILNYIGLLNESLQPLMMLTGFVTAVVNIALAVMWGITEEENNENSWQLSWYNRLSR